MYGDWYLVLVFYNWGEGVVKCVVDKNMVCGLLIDYVSLIMLNEIWQYVFKLQVFKNIFNNLVLMVQFGLLEIFNCLYFVIIDIEKVMDVKMVVCMVNMLFEDFLIFNLLYNCLVIKVDLVVILLVDKLDIFCNNLERNVVLLIEWQIYMFKYGEKFDKVVLCFGIVLFELL